MKKRAETLAKEYDFEFENEYYDYIVVSLINGQRQQVRELFNQMHNDDKQYFLNNYLEEDNSYHTSTRKICIGTPDDKKAWNHKNQLEAYKHVFRDFKLRLTKHDKGTTMLIYTTDLLGKPSIQTMEFDKKGKDITRDYTKPYSIDLGIGI